MKRTPLRCRSRIRLDQQTAEHHQVRPVVALPQGGQKCRRLAGRDRHRHGVGGVEQRRRLARAAQLVPVEDGRVVRSLLGHRASVAFRADRLRAGAAAACRVRTGQVAVRTTRSATLPMQQARNAGAAVRRHDDQVGLPPLRRIDDRGCRRAVLDFAAQPDAACAHSAARCAPARRGRSAADRRRAGQRAALHAGVVRHDIEHRLDDEERDQLGIERLGELGRELQRLQ